MARMVGTLRLLLSCGLGSPPWTSMGRSPDLGVYRHLLGTACVFEQAQELSERSGDSKVRYNRLRKLTPQTTAGRFMEIDGHLSERVMALHHVCVNVIDDFWQLLVSSCGLPLVIQVALKD
mmetsp:Transcript_69395/g.127374  ORF Transcript_69395/g.127374 Transcript_69395/m.127374 type:complete len:121 (-) Transcript_69395:11-373(-)